MLLQQGTMFAPRPTSLLSSSLLLGIISLCFEPSLKTSSIHWTGEASSVVQSAVRLTRRPWVPGFDPLAGQAKRQFLCSAESTLVQTYWCLTPIRVSLRHAPTCVRTLKIPYPSVVKELAPKPLVWNTACST